MIMLARGDLVYDPCYEPFPAVGQVIEIADGKALVEFDREFCTSEWIDVTQLALWSNRIV